MYMDTVYLSTANGQHLVKAMGSGSITARLRMPQHGSLNLGQYPNDLSRMYTMYRMLIEHNYVRFYCMNYTYMYMYLPTCTCRYTSYTRTNELNCLNCIHP